MDCWPPVQWVPESSLMIGSRPSHIYFVFCFLDLDFVCSMPSTGFLRLYILSVSLLSVFSFWGIIPHPHYRSLSLFFSLLQDVSLKAFLSYPTRTRELNLNKTCMYIKKKILINKGRIHWRQFGKYKENYLLFYHPEISTVAILLYAFSSCVCPCAQTISTLFKWVLPKVWCRHYWWYVR